MPNLAGAAHDGKYYGRSDLHTHSTRIDGNTAPFDSLVVIMHENLQL